MINYSIFFSSSHLLGHWLVELIPSRARARTSSAWMMLKLAPERRVFDFEFQSWFWRFGWRLDFGCLLNRLWLN